MAQINNLHLRLKELETEHSYQMRQNDALHSLKMKDIHSEYCHAIEELKIKNEVSILNKLSPGWSLMMQSSKRIV